MLKFDSLQTLINLGFEGYVQETWIAGGLLSNTKSADMYVLKKNAELNQACFIVLYYFEDP